MKTVKVYYDGKEKVLMQIMPGTVMLWEFKTMRGYDKKVANFTHENKRVLFICNPKIIKKHYLHYMHAKKPYLNGKRIRLNKRP